MRVQVTVLGCWGLATIGETSSFLVESKEANILLDMCPGVTRQLKQIGFATTELDFMYGSHIHADHLLGTTYLIFQRSVEQRTADAKQVRPIKLLGSASVIHVVQESMRLYYPERKFELPVEVINDGHAEIMWQDRVRLTFAQSNHTAECYSIRIDLLESGRSIVYTADGLFTDHTLELCHNADLLIGEAFGTVPDYESTYQTIKHSLGTHLGVLASRAGVRRVLPFHMHPRYDTEMTKKHELLAEIRENFNGEIIWPRDLMAITV
jgi:ribonuclease Z